MLSKRSVKLFRKASKEVPAYKYFLQNHDFNPNQIKTPHDLKEVPLTSKKNYLVPNEMKNLIWGKDLDGLLLLCATSGSTGEPYYFARNERLSWQYSHILERFLKQSSYGKGRVLVLNGFGMGVWIGGIITHRAFEIAVERINFPVTILPVGYNKKELFKALKRLAPDFDQTIIVGYPPFTKELVDEAEGEGIDLKKLNIRLLFAAEAFTETFRNYVCKKAGVKNPVLDTLNIYGTADIGAMAYETPLSILIRRLVIENPYLYKDVFKQLLKTPTLAQFNPEFIEFEEMDGRIILTGNGALPLIRYDVGDNGGVISYVHLKKLLNQYDVDLEKEIDRAGIKGFISKDPFVYVYERSDFSTSIQGINIYPEFIKEALLDNEMTGWFTERFTMSTKTDIRHNQFLQINLELQKDIKPSKNIKDVALEIILNTLTKKSSEFAEVSKNRNNKKLVQIVIWENGHPRYFKPGTKQQWVEKN